MTNNAAKTVREWLVRHLAAPHVQLGRSGHVCPYVFAAMAKDAIDIDVRAGRLGAPELRALIQDGRSRLLARIAARPDLRPFHALVFAFPGFGPAEDSLIESVQYVLKPDFVAEGLMLGEFHPRHAAGGLHNPDFRALQSPMHLLVVRELVRQDIRFLSNTDYPAEVESKFLAAYHAKFGKEAAS